MPSMLPPRGAIHCSSIVASPRCRSPAALQPSHPLDSQRPPGAADWAASRSETDSRSSQSCRSSRRCQAISPRRALDQEFPSPGRNINGSQQGRRDPHDSSPTGHARPWPGRPVQMIEIETTIIRDRRPSSSGGRGHGWRPDDYSEGSHCVADSYAGEYQQQGARLVLASQCLTR